MRNRTGDVLRLLKDAPIFHSVEPQLLEGLAAQAEVRSYRKGIRLYRRGEKSDTLLLVVTGHLNLFKPMAGKEDMFLRRLGAGALVGWSILAGEAHTADLLAADKLEVAVIPGMALRRLFRERPEVPLMVIASLGVLLGQLSDEKADLRYRSLDERTHKTLERLAPPGEVLRITQAELALAVGATRARVSEAMARLKAEGLVTRGRGWVRCLP